MANDFGCKLTISTNEYHPTIVTELTTVQPTKMYIKGSPFKTFSGKLIPEKLNETNLWVLDTGKIIEQDGQYLNKAIESLLDIVEENMDGFKKAFQMFEHKHMSCYAYYREFNPYFIFTSDLLKRLNNFPIDIEFDVYFLGDSRED